MSLNGAGSAYSRPLGSTGWHVGTVGLGCWQLGADWGDIPEADALRIVDAAVTSGATFLDTADVFGDGRSEQLIGRYLAVEPREGLVIATKIGRRAVPHVAEAYTATHIRSWVEQSRHNLRVDRLDVVLLHCPPMAVYAHGVAFDVLDELVADGVIAAYGVSADSVDSAMAAITRTHISCVELVVNPLRQEAIATVLPTAQRAGIGIIVRSPLASGLLAGHFDPETQFAPNDHRYFNRDGKVFAALDTFAGLPFSVGLNAMRRLRTQLGHDVDLAAFTLRWILDQPAVSVVVPGARRPWQARQNLQAVFAPDITPSQRELVTDVYHQALREAAAMTDIDVTDPREAANCQLATHGVS